MTREERKAREERTAGREHEVAEPGQGSRRRGRTVRQRVLVLMIALMALGLSLTGVLTFLVEYGRLAERVDAELVQEVDEMTALANAGPATDGAPFSDVEALFVSFLTTAVAGEDEAFLALIEQPDEGGQSELQPVYVSGGERPFEITHPDVLMAVQQAQPEPGQAHITSVRTQDTELRLIVADVQLPGEAREAQFVVAIDIGRQRGEVNQRLATYALVSWGSLVVAAVLGHVLLGRLLRPLRDLREATAHISPADLSRRVDLGAVGDNDVAELAVRFNQMLDRIEAGVREQRQFLDDAAHELRTPLTILRGNTELLRPDDEQEVAATRELMLDEVDRMQRLVDDLLVLARAQRPDFVRRVPTDLTELAVECMERVTSLGDRQWQLAADAEGTVRLDRQRIIQAVVQLAANSVKFSQEGTAIELGLRWVEPGSDEAARARTARTAGAGRLPVAAAGAGAGAGVAADGSGEEGGDRMVALSVSDRGTGIPESQLARVFDRFSRSENATNVDGSGLGLAIVKAIADAHGGAVGAVSVEGLGSRFTLWLPAEQPEEAGDRSPAE